MFTFVRDAWGAAGGHAAPTLFMAFFAYVWAVWTAKTLAARRYRPARGQPSGLRASVIVPVFNEPEAIWRRVLASVVANRPFELIAVVDGGDAEIAAIAREYCDDVVRIPKAGKRAAIAAGLRGDRPRDGGRDRARLRHGVGRGHARGAAAPVLRSAGGRRDAPPGACSRPATTPSAGSRTGSRTSATT